MREGEVFLSSHESRRHYFFVPVSFLYLLSYCIPSLSLSLPPSLSLYIYSPCLVDLDDCKTVDITVFVDKDTAGPLTATKEKLEDILVLHLQGGRDIFVSFLTELLQLAG